MADVTKVFICANEGGTDGAEVFVCYADVSLLFLMIGVLIVLGIVSRIIG